MSGASTGQATGQIPGHTPGRGTERTRCTCHDIDEEEFRAACRAGARTVKTCFKSIGCMPKCNNCIPMVRSVLSEFDPSVQSTVALVATSPQASKSEDTYEADVQDQDRPHAGQRRQAGA